MTKQLKVSGSTLRSRSPEEKGKIVNQRKITGFENNDWEDLAELSFKKRFPDGVSKDFNKLQKQKNFLLNKGFTFYQIESVLD